MIPKGSNYAICFFSVFVFSPSFFLFSASDDLISNETKKLSPQKKLVLEKENQKLSQKEAYDLWNQMAFKRSSPDLFIECLRPEISTIAF